MKGRLLLASGILLLLLGFTLLVALGMTHVKPYLKTKHLEQAFCTTVSKSVSERLVTCTCATDGSSACLSNYPCIKLMVNVTSRPSEIILDNVTLYDSYETLQLQREKLQCSFHKCSRVQRANFQATGNFADTYGEEGLTFLCYYNSLDLTYAILDIVTKTSVIHAILWPCLLCLAGFSILFMHVFQVGFLAKKKTRKTTQRASPYVDNYDNAYERVDS